MAHANPFHGTLADMEAKIIGLLEAKGPLTGEEIRSALGGDGLDLWRACKRSAALEVRTVGTRYIFTRNDMHSSRTIYNHALLVNQCCSLIYCPHAVIITGYYWITIRSRQGAPSIVLPAGSIVVTICIHQVMVGRPVTGRPVTPCHMKAAAMILNTMQISVFTAAIYDLSYCCPGAVIVISP